MFPLGVIIFIGVFKQYDASIFMGFKYAPLQKFLFKSLNEEFTSGFVMSIVLARLPHLSTIQMNFEFDPLVKLHKMKGSCVSVLHPFAPHKEKFLFCSRVFSLS